MFHLLPRRKFVRAFKMVHFQSIFVGGGFWERRNDHLRAAKPPLADGYRAAELFLLLETEEGYMTDIHISLDRYLIYDRAMSAKHLTMKVGIYVFMRRLAVLVRTYIQHVSESVQGYMSDIYPSSVFSSV